MQVILHDDVTVQRQAPGFVQMAQGIENNLCQSWFGEERYPVDDGTGDERGLVGRGKNFVATSSHVWVLTTGARSLPAMHSQAGALKQVQHRLWERD